MIYYMNAQGKIDSINRGGLEVMDLDAEADMMPGQDFTHYIHEDDQDKVMNAFRESVAAREEISKGLTFRFVKRDGGIVWVELHSRLSYDEKGEFLEEVGILRDITERRRMDEELARLNRELEHTNRKLQAAYQWMRDNRDLLKESRHEEDIGFLVDRDGKIEWISEAALSLLGKSRLAAIGGNLAELLHEESREAFRKALHQGWTGVTFPFPARFSQGKGADMSMEAKITRLTSCETRRLWVLFQRPAERVMEAVGA